MSFKRSLSLMSPNISERLDRSSSIRTQKSLELLYTTAKQEGKVRTYNKVKYQGLIYKVGQFVQIHHLGSNCPYVGKLINIASLIQIENSQDQEDKIEIKCPVIEVEWYLKKSDLSRDPQFPRWDQFLSANEVFASGQIFTIPIESIMGKCEVLTLDEYYVLSFTENSIYFTRASYDMNKKKLSPDVNKWSKRYCYCENPYNPDIEYVQCEKCKKWYHNDCVIKQNQDIKNFVCKNCTKKEQVHKKKK